MPVHTALAAPLAAAPTYTLGSRSATISSGSAFALASFGLQIYDDAMAQKLTSIALEEGYRNFFASVLAGNQRGFAKAIAESGIPRSELFICGSVVSNRAPTFDSAYSLTKRGCASNLEAFAVGGIDYVDMIMLDYPGPDCASIRGQWKAFEEMKAAGTARSLAVSNFSPVQLDCLLNTEGATPPTVNQLALNPGLYGPGGTRAIVEQNRRRGVLVQAWSPLGGGRLSPKVRATTAEIGRTYGKSGAQVVLRWIVQSGAAFTTQTKSREHFREDLDIFDFSLTAEEMQQIELSA
uniref:NADP-dependent oxidoreductase domain-containing protein n=1 Tax=Coccolithus braarudii TaxID=221442 RepID=A0A7S0LQE7_9EUKA